MIQQFQIKDNNMIKILKRSLLFHYTFQALHSASSLISKALVSWRSEWQNVSRTTVFSHYFQFVEILILRFKLDYMVSIIVCPPRNEKLIHSDTSFQVTNIQTKRVLSLSDNL